MTDKKTEVRLKRRKLAGNEIYDLIVEGDDTGISIDCKNKEITVLLDNYPHKYKFRLFHSYE